MQRQEKPELCFPDPETMLEIPFFDKVVAGLSRRLAPTIVSGQALCQEHVITGDAIDVRRFPVPVYSPKDGGAYITPGIVVSKDPENGVTDIGHYRFMVLDGKLMSFLTEPHHRLGKNLAKHKRLGLPAKGENYMAYRTVKEFPIVGDVMNKAFEQVATGQLPARDAMNAAQEQAIASLHRAGSTL